MIGFIAMRLNKSTRVCGGKERDAITPNRLQQEENADDRCNADRSCQNERGSVLACRLDDEAGDQRRAESAEICEHMIEAADANPHPGSHNPVAELSMAFSRSRRTAAS